jgi:hypothetical protein
MYSTSPPISNDLKSIRVDRSFIQPGDSVNFYITNLVDSGPFFYKITGRTTSTNFSDGTISGPVTLTTGKLGIGYATISKKITDSTDTIGSYFSIDLMRDSIEGSVLLSSPTVVVTEFQTPQSFASVTPSSYVGKEGETISFHINITDSVGQIVEDIKILNSGTFYSTTTSIVLSDPETAGGTTATASISVDEINGTITSVSIINSGSGYLSAPTVSFTENTTGTLATFKVTIPNTGMSSGTYNWSTIGTVSADDFVDNILTGTVLISNNAGVITRTLSTVTGAEAGEIFSIEISKDFSNSTQLGKSSNVLVASNFDDLIINAPSATSTVITTSTGGVAIAYDYSQILNSAIQNLENISSTLGTISSSLISIIDQARTTGIRTESSYDWVKPTEIYSWYNQQLDIISPSVDTAIRLTAAINTVTSYMPKFQ